MLGQLSAGKRFEKGLFRQGKQGMVCAMTLVRGQSKESHLLYLLHTYRFLIYSTRCLDTLASVQLHFSSPKYLKIRSNYFLSIRKRKQTFQYQLNTKGRNDTKFGNTMNLEAGIFFPIPKSKTIINPLIGMMYERSKKNKVNHIERKFTGENSLYLDARVSITKKKVEFIFSSQIPIINKTPEQRVKKKPSISASINYYF